MKKVLLGLFVGLLTWLVLGTVLTALLGPMRLRWAVAVVPVSLASILCGSIVQKHGPVCGCILGVLNVLLFTALGWFMGLANYQSYPFREFMKDVGFRYYLMVPITILVGVGGGYVGQLLVRVWPRSAKRGGRTS